MIFRNGLFACVAAAALTTWAGGALAADATDTTTAAAATDTAAADNGGAIGAVIVTARKQSENLQRVPVAVTSQTGNQLAQQRITEPTDLAKVTPSFFVRNSSSSGNSAQFALRGQYAADSLLGISQPVGLYEDTVNIPHPFGANNPFFDISRVEVLKGPQGTLYGRNTTAGAVNIITRGADYSGVHGFLDGELGSFKDMRLGGAINIPIIDNVLAVRLAYQRWTRDGYGHSSVTNQTFGDGLDSNTARLSVKFDPTSNFTATAKVEYSHNDNAGPDLYNISQSGTLAVMSDALWLDYGKYAPLLQAGLHGDNNALAQVLAAGHSALDPCIGGNPYVNCAGATQFDRLTTWHAALDMTWHIGGSVNLRSITGYHSFVNWKNGDLAGIQAQVLDIGFATNGTPVAPAVVPPGGYPINFALKPDQSSYQISQELDLTGKAWDNRVSWLAGFYFSSDRGKGSQQAGDLEELFPILVGSAGLNPLNTASLSPPLFAHDDLRMDSSQWALFTQDDIKLNDIFSITVGARYTSEHLVHYLSNWHFDTASQTYTCDVAPTVQYTSEPDCSRLPAAAGPNNSWLSANYGAFTYVAGLNAQITPNTLAYFKASRGFRGGAYGRSNGPPAKPEYDQDYELGLKTDLFEHRLRINLALYQSNITDKQVSALQCINFEAPPCGSEGFTTTILNAAAERVRGVELEFVAAPVRGLTITGNGSYTDAVYTSFPGAVSGDGVQLCQVNADLTLSPSTTPCSATSNPTSDAKGLPVAVTPTWQGDIGARYEWPVGPGTLGIQGDVNYRGKFPITAITHQTAIPISIEQYINRAVTLLNLSMDYKLEDQGLTFSLFATNVTNVAWGYEGISANYTGGIGHEYMQAPREFGFTVRKTFGGG